MHESLPASFSMLPLAQRLVSIEVQDDYKLLTSSRIKGQNSHDKSIQGQISLAWDNFVDNAWDIFFESRHQKLNVDQEQEQKQTKAHQTDLTETRKLNSQTRHTRAQQRQKKTEEDLSYSELADQRVQLFDQYVRKALLPTGTDQDFKQNIYLTDAQNNGQYDYFVKWIRSEYLIARYGLAVQQAVKKNPTLRDDAAGLNSVGDTRNIDGEEVEVPLHLILPKVDTIIDAFGMQDWSRTKVPVSYWTDSEDSSASNDNISIKSLIHDKLRGQISYSGPLNAYFEMRRREDSYELWSYDYIFGLAQYLLDRIKSLDDSVSAPVNTTILDVGAGDGRLIYFLRRAMQEIRTSNSSKSSVSTNLRLGRKSKMSRKSATAKIKGNSQTLAMPTLIATDDGSWKAPIYSSSQIEVEKLSAAESIAKYSPPPTELRRDDDELSRLIVICSWMPPNHDFTADFRRPQSSINAPGESGIGIVDEYILIGECDDGSCGHNYLTWANPDALPESERGSTFIAPYTEDGYHRVDLEDLSRLQISRFDCKRSSESKTVSFRRGV